MDEGDPNLERRIREILEREITSRRLQYHELRYRRSGTSVWVELHLLLPGDLSLEEAHRIATEIEQSVKRSLDVPVHITSHLEPAEVHDRAHQVGSA